jgi:BirA family transcriptional regulator, biotin operon repressor / biotin---[acetyl-CoA-carboxylase] ligase
MDNPNRPALDAALISAHCPPPFTSITVIDCTGSTNDDLKKNAANLTHGSVLVSNAQTAGKGRNGRTFVSAPGVGIYCSILLKPKFDPHNYLRLSILSGIILCETIREYTGIAPTLKWPNDILIRGKKVAGILCESQYQANKASPFIIGWGLNVYTQDFPKELEDSATTLEDNSSWPLDRNLLIQDFLIRLAAYLPRLEDLELGKMAYTYDLKRGTPITVHDPKGAYPANIVGINDLGQLIINRGEDISTLVSYEITIREDEEA